MKDLHTITSGHPQSHSEEPPWRKGDSDGLPEAHQLSSSHLCQFWAIAPLLPGPVFSLWEHPWGKERQANSRVRNLKPAQRVPPRRNDGHSCCQR